MPRRPRRAAATQRKSPKQPRAHDTVAVILTAAERLLARDGLEALTTARIAEVAGISVGSLYQYYPNKEAICGALIERFTEQFHQAMVAAVAATRLLPYELALRAVIEGVFAAFRANARVHGGLMEVLPAAGRQELYRRYLARYTDAIAQALADRGSEVRGPPDLVAYVLIRAADGVIQAITQDPMDEARARRIVDEVWCMGVAYLRPAAKT